MCPSICYGINTEQKSYAGMWPIPTSKKGEMEVYVRPPLSVLMYLGSLWNICVPHTEEFLAAHSAGCT